MPGNCRNLIALILIVALISSGNAFAGEPVTITSSTAYITQPFPYWEQDQRKLDEAIHLAEICVKTLDTCQADLADLEATPCAEITIPDPFTFRAYLIGGLVGAIVGAAASVAVVFAVR